MDQWWLLQISSCKDKGLLVKKDSSGGSDPGYDGCGGGWLNLAATVVRVAARVCEETGVGVETGVCVGVEVGAGEGAGAGVGPGQHTL